MLVQRVSSFYQMHSAATCIVHWWPFSDTFCLFFSCSKTQHYGHAQNLFIRRRVLLLHAELSHMSKGEVCLSKVIETQIELIKSPDLKQIFWKWGGFGKLCMSPENFWLYPCLYLTVDSTDKIQYHVKVIHRMKSLLFKNILKLFLHFLGCHS